MNRVWLSVLLFVSLAGSPWLSPPVRGENDDLRPSADTGHDGQLEEMRSYGECQWYDDREHHHNAVREMTDAVAGSELDAPAMAEAEMADEATVAAEPPAASEAGCPHDCWYDGETDAYYDYEFSNAGMVREETAEASAEAVESYAAEGADESADESADEIADETADEIADETWSGSYEFPSETAASQPCDEEITWVEDLPAANPGNESMDCDEYPSPSEGNEYPLADADETELAGEQSTQTMETSEEVMEGTWEADTADLEANEPSSICPSAEYDYEYRVQTYGYDNGEDIYTAPALPSDEMGETAEVMDGEGCEEAVAPLASSDAAEFDSEVILSLARTLDRVSMTLQSLSRYLTDLATTDLAHRTSDTLER